MERVSMRDEASSSTFGILGALVMFAATMSFAYSMASADTARLEDLLLQHDADMLAGHLLSPIPGDWTASPDAITRFSLMGARDPERVDARALELLARGGLDARANGAPDYADVKNATGIPHDFHLGVKEIKPPRADAAWTPIPARVAYFGHYSGARAAVAAGSWANATTTEVNVTVSITNRASIPAIFTVNVALGDAATGRAAVSQDRHTTLLAPGETQKVWVTVPALSSWQRINAVRVSITDPYGNPATDTVGAQIPAPWVSVTMPTSDPAAYALVLQAANPYYVSGNTVNFEISAHDGRGNTVSKATTRFVLMGPTGDEWANASITTGNGDRTWSCTNCTVVGNYTSKLLDASGRTIALDRVHVSQARMFEEKRTPDALALAEMSTIDALVTSFDPTRFDAATAAGDVFGDDVNGPSELPGVLSRYDVVIVGSEASHHALAPADVKRSITAWIDAGGVLVVFGAAQEPSRWLQSEYGLALSHAPGSPTAPVADHPLLTDPEPLAHASYVYRSRAWQIPETAQFEHVLTLGATAEGGSMDALALSPPGAYGNGTIVITSYMPGALTADAADGEAQKFLHNLLVRATGLPIVDFGPPIPSGIPVAAASRVIVAARAGEGDVAVVRVTVHVFG